MRFNGQPLVGANLGALVQTVVDVLNTGEAVCPLPAWISMSISEVDAIRHRWENWLRDELGARESALLALSKQCDDVTATFERRDDMIAKLEAILTDFMTSYTEDVEATVGLLEGDLAVQVLSASQGAVQRIMEDSRSRHLAAYEDILQQWLRKLIEV